MYLLQKLCCVCLKADKKLRFLYDTDSHGQPHYNKLTLSITEMNFKEMNNERLICEGCCVILNTAYDFRQMCLRSKAHLMAYVSRLRASDLVRSANSTQPDFRQGVKLENQQIEIKQEIVDASYTDYECASMSKCICEYENLDRAVDSVCIKEETKSDLKYLSDVDDDGVSYLVKLTTSVTEMNFEEMYNQRLICEECCVILNTVYSFRQMCLRSKANLTEENSSYTCEDTESTHFEVKLEYVENRPEMDDVNMKCSKDALFDYTQQMIKEEIVIKQERRTSLEDSPTSVCASLCDTTEDNGHSFIPIKKERPTKEDYFDLNLSRNDESDRANESADSWSENIEFVSIKCEVGLEEYPLADVKEEPVPESETPPDGSTNQAAGISEATNEHGKKIILTATRRPHKCEKCGIFFVHKTELTRHLRVHSGERLFECEVCKKNFNHKSNLTKHSLLHSGGKSYECEVCKKNFTQNSHLSQHLLLHSGERPYECEICKKAFTQKCNLTTHLLMHSGERSYGCEVCGKRFIHNSHLTSHMLIHSGERPHECGVCRNSFTRKSSLTKHMRIHCSDRAHGCEICGKIFNQQGSLTKHLQMHSGERPHSCDACGKSFIQRHNLLAHIRIHSGEIKCKTCKKMFISKYALTKHMMIHSGERPYSCEVCTKSFNQQSSLNRHMNIHIGDK